MKKTCEIFKQIDTEMCVFFKNIVLTCRETSSIFECSKFVFGFGVQLFCGNYGKLARASSFFSQNLASEKFACFFKMFGRRALVGKLRYFRKSVSETFFRKSWKYVFISPMRSPYVTCYKASLKTFWSVAWEDDSVFQLSLTIIETDVMEFDENDKDSLQGFHRNKNC